MHLTFRLLAFPLLLTALAAQEPPDAESILEKSNELYRSAKSFHFVASEKTITRSKGFERKTSTFVLTATDGAGRTRVEFDNQSAGGVAVSNGEKIWLFVPEAKQYMEAEAAPDGGFPKAPGMDFNAFLRRFPHRYSALAERVIQAAVVREETVETSQGNRPCWVIEAEYSPPPGLNEGKIDRTYWIDRETGVVLKEVSVASMLPQNADARVEVTQTIGFQIATAGSPLPEDLFEFQPPADATKVAALRPASSRSEPAGEGGQPPGAAPDFTLSDLEGNPVQLSSLRGKAVLLDFWASWCGPCRYDMPHIEDLHKQYGDKGLVVLGINAEDSQVAQRYLERHGYTFPTLSDGGYRVSRLYRVRALPTIVVIDREGRISSYMRGLQTEEQLRAAVEKVL